MTITNDLANFAGAANSTTIFANGGNVGIGTTSPTTKLDVNGTTALRGAVTIANGSYTYLNNSDNTNQFFIYNVGAAGSTNAALAFVSSTVAERMRIDASGNVGIGTSPASTLHVAKTTSSGTYRTELRIDNQDQRTTLASYYQSGVAQKTILRSEVITTGSAIPIAFEVGSTEAMTIAANGNIGIGNTAPTNKLSVNGTTYLGNTTISGSISTSSTLYFGGISGAVNGNSNPLIYADGTNMVLKPGSGNGTLLFQNYSGVEKSRLDFSNGDWFIHYLYDFDNHNFYLDLNGTSRVNYFWAETIRSQDNWWLDSGGNNRMIWQNGSHSYHRSWNYHIFRNSTDADVHYIAPDGNVWMGLYKDWLSTQIRSGIFYDQSDTYYQCDPNGTTRLNYLITQGGLDVLGNDIGLYGGAPTIWFRDADGQNGIWHNNSSTMYLLRSDNASSGYSTVGSGNWPMLCYLYSNDFVFGGAITSIYGMYQNASDRRLKDNIVEIPNAIDKIKQIRGVTFSWNATADAVGFKPDQRDDVGVIAQEIQAVLPRAVHLAPFDTWSVGADEKFTVEEMIEKRKSSKSGENYLTVQMEKIVPLLIEGIKEQQLQIEGLQKQINDLINMMNNQ